jgi:hypothetical protein
MTARRAGTDRSGRRRNRSLVITGFCGLTGGTGPLALDVVPGASVVSAHDRSLLTGPASWSTSPRAWCNPWSCASRDLAGRRRTLA